MNETERTKHDSFGQIRFIRTNSNGTNFFGSELKQNNYISLEIDFADISRELTQDRYYGYKNIIRLRMSSGQFSELITSMNSGGGSPCTIERLQGVKIEELPKIESRKDFVHRKFEDRMFEFAVRLKEKQKTARELIKKPKLSKKDIIQLDHHIEWLTQEVENNIPFFGKCFQENMDEVVLESKMEIENAIQHKINSTGIEALRNIGNKKAIE